MRIAVSTSTQLLNRCCSWELTNFVQFIKFFQFLIFFVVTSSFAWRGVSFFVALCAEVSLRRARSAAQTSVHCTASGVAISRLPKVQRKPRKALRESRDFLLSSPPISAVFLLRALLWTSKLMISSLFKYTKHTKHQEIAGFQKNKQH